VKIHSVKANNRKRAIEVSTPKGEFDMPYARLVVVPTSEDPIIDLYVDDELGREGFTYRLRSGAEDTLHVDAVLDYNREPGYMRDLLVHELSIQAKRCVEASGLSKREIIRRTGTSPSQFYRLLDTANTKKSIDGLINLFTVLDCEVGFEVKQPQVNE